jgi:putative phosphoesterase
MREVLQKGKPADLIIHLGDGERDTVGFADDAPFARCLCVKGNCDPGQTVTERLVTEAGKTIFLTHGHMYYVKSGLERLKEKAAAVKADIVLYGHTHMPSEEYDPIGKTYYLNPGSISDPKGEKHPTYGVVEIIEGKITTSIVRHKTGWFL